jgi:Domain of unknown function (DUF4129)
MRRLAGTAPVLVIAVVLAALWATNAGPASFVGAAPDGKDASRQIRQKLGHAGAQHGPPPQQARHSSGSAWVFFELVSYLVLGACVVVLCIYVVSATWSNRRASRERLREAALVRDAIEASTVPAVLVTSTEEQLRAIRKGTPRNAIVACWWQLERASEATGFPRFASETSAEFTKRVLGRYSVRPSTIETLAALYREARFSVHVMAEDDREQAVSALEQVLVDLRTRASRTTPVAQP